MLKFCKNLASSTAAFQFQIYGDGGSATEVREWIINSRDRRFSFDTVLTESAFVDALLQTDFFVITEKAQSGASFFPSKTVPGLATGTPILAVSDPESALGREMRTHEVGPWFSWDRCTEVGDLLESIERRDHEFLAWQSNAIRRSEAFVRDHCLDFIESTFHSILANRFDVETTGVLDARSARLPA